jgi:segregation and condensation protein A
MSYNVKLEIFEGPMDLLLHLVKKEEIDIYKISVSKIIDEYLNYISLMKDLDINIASEFLVMASTLLELKSKLILPPVPEILRTEELSDEDTISTPEELLNKIVEYQKFKEIGELLSELEKTEKKYFLRPVVKSEEEEEKSFSDLSVDDLVFALQNMLKRKNEKVKVKILQRETVTVEEMKSFIIGKFSSKKEFNFLDLFTQDVTKLRIITGFIALLELILEKKLRVKQEKRFDNIWIYSK